VSNLEATAPPCPRCTGPTELRGKSRTPYCRNCHQFIQDGTLGDCRYRSSGPSLVWLDDDEDDDEDRQSATACCPRQTIPDSCSCLEGCGCICLDCDCTGRGEEQDDD
jgi:hypothetical protein